MSHDTSNLNLLVKQLRARHKDLRDELRRVDDARGDLEAAGAPDSELADLHARSRELDGQMLCIERYMAERRLPVAALWGEAYGDTIPVVPLPEVQP